jgi:hypothetical protein
LFFAIIIIFVFVLNNKIVSLINIFVIIFLIYFAILNKFFAILFEICI